jgi:hypothetical protein
MLKGTKMESKRCRYCKRLFIPDPRVGERQKSCGDPLCQKAHKVETNARWRGRNLDYFKNDYPRVKEWLDHHPGYLKEYRESHPEYVKKNREAQRIRDRSKKLRLDIQAEIKRQAIEITDKIWNLPHLDIQDEKFLQPLEITFLFSTLPCLAIQVPLDNPFCLRDNATIHTGRLASCP